MSCAKQRQCSVIFSLDATGHGAKVATVTPLPKAQRAGQVGVTGAVANMHSTGA